jgi:heptosyltransferase-2
MKYLIIGPAWVGDMVMSQSLYKLLKNNSPAAKITVLAPSYTLPLLNAMPEVDEALPLNFPRRKLSFLKRRALGRSLKDKGFTEAIVLPNSFKSALVPYFANISKRTGFIGEFRYGFLNDWRKLEAKRYPKMIDRFCALGLPAGSEAKDLPHPELILKKEWEKTVNEKWPPEPIFKPILAICPGAEFGPAKQWPAKHFAELAFLKIKAGWKVWLFGSKKDEKVGQEIMEEIERLAEQGSAGLNVCSFIGSTSLEEAMVLLSRATAVVSNDSGLMHIASALQKPVVALYGSTSANFTPPLSQKAKVVTLNLSCQPCFQRVCPLKGEAHMACLNHLKPSFIEQELEKILLPTHEINS